MKFYIRFLGLVIAERDLEAGEYIIGRGSECDIRLTQDFISRRHGKLFSQDGKWFYQDLRESHPHYSNEAKELTNLNMIELENDIDLMLADYLDQEKTQVYDITDLKTIMTRATRNRHRIRIALSLIMLLMLGLSGSYTYYYYTKPMDAKQLLSFVRPKVVEFEMLTDRDEVEQLKKMVDIKDSDVKKSIGFCSGFIVAPNIVLSAMHCIRGQNGPIEVNTDFRIKTHDGKFHKVSKILGFDVLRDFVYLQVSGLDNYGSLAFANMHKVGQKVYTVGNVGGQGIAIRDGIMASTTKDPNNPEVEYLRFSAAASPGNSGGPLVDGYGKIVGIVFAGTFSENYNIATASETLIKGKQHFVDNSQSKKIVVKPDDVLNFNIQRQISAVNIPQLYSWSEHPKFLRDLHGIQFEVQVPDKLENFAHQMAENFNHSIRLSYDSMLKKMQAANLGEGSWHSFTSEERPILSPHNITMDNYYIYNNKQGLPSIRAYEMVSPPSRRQFDLFLKNKESRDYLNNTNQIGRLENSTNQFHSMQHNGKMSVSSLSYVSFADLDFENPKWNQIRNPEPSLLMDKLVGTQGMLFDTRYFSFVRPKAHQSFTLQKIPSTAKVDKITDSADRQWTRYSWEILNTGRIDLHCASLPQGYLCAAQHYPAVSEALLKIMRQNYYRYHLSQVVLRPQFWSLDALQDFSQQEGTMALSHLSDITLKQDDQGLSITLKSLGAVFKLRKVDTPKAIRILSAYQRQDDKTGKWIALGFETIGTTATRTKLCTMLIDPEQKPIWKLDKYKKMVKKQFWGRKAKLQDEKLPSELLGVCRFYTLNKDKTQATLDDKINQAFRVKFSTIKP